MEGSRKMKPTKGFCGLVVIGTLLPMPAYAYLDPGTGGMLLQLLVGAIAGSLVFLRLKWTQVKGFFSRKQRTPDAVASQSTEDGEAEGK